MPARTADRAATAGKQLEKRSAGQKQSPVTSGDPTQHHAGWAPPATRAEVKPVKTHWIQALSLPASCQTLPRAGFTQPGSQTLQRVEQRHKQKGSCFPPVSPSCHADCSCFSPVTLAAILVGSVFNCLSLTTHEAGCNLLALVKQYR